MTSCTDVDKFEFIAFGRGFGPYAIVSPNIYILDFAIRLTGEQGLRNISLLFRAEPRYLQSSKCVEDIANVIHANFECLLKILGIKPTPLPILKKFDEILTIRLHGRASDFVLAEGDLRSFSNQLVHSLQSIFEQGI